MSDKNKEYYFLTFDLDSKRLGLFYKNKTINQAWDDVYRFMIKNDFNRNQRSAYISNKKLSKHEVRTVMFEMYRNLPWFPLCAKKNTLSTFNSQQNLLISILRSKEIKKLIGSLIKNPPGLNRGGFSVSGKKQNSPKPAIPPTPTKSDTVTVPLEDLKEIFEAGVDMNVTVKKEELEKAKKQVEDKKQQSGASKKTTAPPEQKKTNKPKR